MRPIWKGQISFGLINIPIELYSAEKNNDLQFKLLDKRNKAKIRYERVNEKTGEEVPWSNVAKAYQLNKKSYVVLEEADFERAAIENTQTFEIEDFIKKEDLPGIYFVKPYYLVPTKQGKKGYVLLREVLKKLDRVAIGKVIIRTRQYLAAVLVFEDVLFLNLLRFTQELRSVADLNIPKDSLKNYKINTKEFDMALKLVESMTVKWNPKKYHDDYRDALMKWIEKKAKRKQIPLPSKISDKQPTKSAEVIDFMELLKKSLKKKKVKAGSSKTKTSLKKRAARK